MAQQAVVTLPWFVTASPPFLPPHPPSFPPQALEHSGGGDFLVCVAGVNPLVGSTLGASELVWDKILGMNMETPVLLLSQLLPHMENRGWRAVREPCPSCALHMCSITLENIMVAGYSPKL
ncbi:hypothetical protein P7K49_017852, partial [Saguinus oedipus]